MGRRKKPGSTKESKVIMLLKNNLSGIEAGHE